MACWKLKELKQHIDHEVELAQYAGGASFTLECLDCNEVLLEFHEVRGVLQLGPNPDEE